MSDYAIWAGEIDPRHWHALAHATSRKVSRVFPPHIQGTLRIQYVPGQQIVVALTETPSPAMRRACLEQRAAVDMQGQLREVDDADARRVTMLAELERIDRETAKAIAQGVEYQGKRHSLSANALAKLDAMLHASAEYPAVVSTIDNLDTFTLESREDAGRLLDAARLRLHSLISEGDRQKAAARSRASRG